MISFASNGSLILAATNDGRMVRVVDSKTGILIKAVYRGKNPA